MRTIVMTGGTSGLGAVAAERIEARPGTRLLLGVRGPAPDGHESLPLDLTSLAAVRGFAAAVVERLRGDRIDALVLNAGMLRRDVDGRTPDGFETTFAVNHLAHHLLLPLLLGHLAPGAVVVLTTSGTHDPAEKAGLPAPRHADARLLAHPENETRREKPSVAGRRAYTASKLCAVLTARALEHLPGARVRRIRGVAYCPGQTPGTGLTRSMRLPLRLAWRLLGGRLRGLVPDLNSREGAGQALADLALAVVRPPDGECYAALRRGRLTWKQPSELARRDGVMHALWHDSAELAGAAYGDASTTTLPRAFPSPT
ncbi:SDR family NAD(P)-dependent oxidoreductase [Georgenia halophila]|uniref:SDR family NAD(P)-dependent oxidoreductase n=1 Tax=Georgenia halophila TaxID=620889 RepID=A0ABP8L432_9MICO